MFYTYCNGNRARRALKLIKNIYNYPLDDILCEVYDEFAVDIDIENIDSYLLTENIETKNIQYQKKMICFYFVKKVLTCIYMVLGCMDRLYLMI